jgi:hypothetical protein
MITVDCGAIPFTQWFSAFCILSPTGQSVEETPSPTAVKNKVSLFLKAVFYNFNIIHIINDSWGTR